MNILGADTLLCMSALMPKCVPEFESNSETIHLFGWPNCLFQEA